MGYLPDFHESSVAAVRLLQGAVYLDDTKSWDLVLAHKSRLESYFARIGLVVIIDEPEGFAYVRQIEEHEFPEGYEKMPKLLRKSRLGYELTLFCVLLRDEFRRFDEQSGESERCIIDMPDLFSRLRELLPDGEDEVRAKKKLEHLLARAMELGFVRKLPSSPPVFEIKPIIKARITAERLEELKEQIASYAESRKESPVAVSA